MAAVRRTRDEKLMLILEAENSSVSDTARRHGCRRASIHEWRRALTPIEPIRRTLRRLEETALALMLANLLPATNDAVIGEVAVSSEVEMLRAQFGSISAWEERLDAFLRLVDEGATNGSISPDLALTLLLSVWSPMREAMDERFKIATRLHEIRVAEEAQERRLRFNEDYEDAVRTATAETARWEANVQP